MSLDFAKGFDYCGRDEYDSEKEDQVGFLESMLEYLKSADTLRTFRFNQPLPKKILRFLLQSTQSTIINFSFCPRELSYIPPVTKHLSKFTFMKCSSPGFDDEDRATEEFYRSLNNVDHIKTDILACVPLIGYNNKSTSISMPSISRATDDIQYLWSQVLVMSMKYYSLLIILKSPDHALPPGLCLPLTHPLIEQTQQHTVVDDD
ncbi:hypothetical protein SAMD00019534_123300 [Acytostelium subglobosum LB1]|uniref:hypothetical protein n=1 Tax=Acytostelium subglobosum LB1 TaxID=1410327 RepID=UPI000644D677|nr:hypothetical protein SAMD00019534_123300 [Acytostelium subglobosum LB1]GAM29154.1 hypothetical protein SAMD00019534_123300 [Acytostelium subglobosum LB1]|eukprot:XP_012747845.1 hypothetical protein SAMD00019534_123300 [Acytostelium subglobosum LB1]